MSTADPLVPPDALRNAGRRYLGAPLRPRTYSRVLYLLLAFPLGIVYFVGLVTGTAVGAGLLLTWIGLPILLGTLAGAAVAAGIEARLASRFVGVDAAVPAVLGEFDARDGLTLPGDGFLDAIRRLVTAPSTWTSVVLVAGKFVFGTVAFVAVVTVGAVTAALLAAPLLYGRSSEAAGAWIAPTGAYQVGRWTITTLPEALAAAGVGVVCLVVGLNLLSGLARAHAEVTAAILRAGRGD